MKASLRLVGESRSPVMVIDQATGHAADLIALAAALAPFPPSAGNNYPGVRRIITPEDKAADAYVRRLLAVVEPLLGGGFHVGAYELLEASFSMVTATPDSLTAPQRAPHFDSTSPNYLALLHYLSDTPGTGTAFFRQRDTGIEVVDADNVGRFVAAARIATPAEGYIHGSTAQFEQIDAVEGIPDRLVIYRGGLLHSGIIPPDMPFSADPQAGRLTANIFIAGC
jgi:hypothetical protein